MANNFRIGLGYDIHAFTKGDHIIVGGVRIPYYKGISAHSDGDVLVHAICDSILGAAALGDIGTNFPNNDEKYRNISSLVLLKESVEKLATAGYIPVNIDCTLICEEPKISLHYNDIRKNISLHTGLDINAVSVKATTNESLGTIGRKEGIAAMSITLVTSNNIQSLV